MRSLKRDRITIGILTGWVTYPGSIHTFVDNVFKGIKSAADQLECNLLFGCGVGSPFNESSHPAMPLVSSKEVDFIPVGPWNTDGIIILGPLANENLLTYFQGLLDSGFPVVFAGGHDTGPSVVVDNEGGITQAVDHLIEHGHQNIVFLSGGDLEHGDTAARYRGYRRSLERYGIPYDPDLVAAGNNTNPASYNAIVDLIKKGVRFSAVIANNDESAVGAINALSECGHPVPQKVALIGFDDRLEARANVPLLTTVHHPMFELGYQSMNLVAQVIRGETRPDTIVRIPTHLVIRESCGCLPGVIPSGNKKNQSSFVSRFAPSPTRNRIEPRQAYSSHYYVDNRSTVLQSILIEMSAVVFKESQRLSFHEVELLCNRLLDSYLTSLKYGDSDYFRQAVQQTIEHIIEIGDDIYSWQSAVSVLRDWTPELWKAFPLALNESQVESLLHKARISINEMLRGQISRLMVGETTFSTNISHMISRFFAAHSEEEIFRVFVEDLPLFGIQNAAVMYYQKHGEDPFHTSLVKISSVPGSSQTVFPTREFPPTGFFSNEKADQIVLLPVHGPEGPIGAVAFQTEDYSNLGTLVRQMAAALRGARLYQEAIAARQLAEEANYLKSRFLSIVSHELRTPLNLIIGLSNMMLKESDGQVSQDCVVNRKDLERVYIGAEHLESLIRDVLDLARSDIGQLKLALEIFDLREILMPVNDIGSQLAKDKDLTWHEDIPDTPIVVYGDRVRLRQVILNLINNALKFTMRGSISLIVRNNAQVAEIRVSDTGLGIPKEEQGRIFNEFQQSTRTSSRGFGGLGLGLSICRSLVEMHGGTIVVQSGGEEGSGSTFSFTIPLAKTQQVEQESSLPVEAISENIVLLVKNNDQASLLCDFLNSIGNTVSVYDLSTTQDWLYQVSQKSPRKIFIDLQLTAEQGWVIVKMLKDNPATQNIPVSFYNLDAQKEVGALVNLDLLNKPLGLNELIDTFFDHDIFREINSRKPDRPILIVDDDEDILELHERLIETLACGHLIMKARNGKEALEIIRNTSPALVLLDLLMPEMDGFELLEAMQDVENGKNVPVVVLSSQSLSFEDINRLNNGVVSVLKKGMFTTQETLQTINLALSRKQKTNSDTRQIVFKAILFIQHHYAETVSRSDIANFVGMSERHLSRCFTQEVGISPIAYLNRYRIYQAKILLTARRKAITEIALEVGFSNSGYFTRVFRDEVGMSPREYVQAE